MNHRRRSARREKHCRKYRKHHGDLMKAEWKPEHVEYMGSGPPPRYFPRTQPYIDTPRIPEFPPWGSSDSDEYIPEMQSPYGGGIQCCIPPQPHAYASPSILSRTPGRSRTPPGYSGKSLRGHFQLAPIGDWDGAGDAPVQRILYARSPISRATSPVRYADRTPMTKELLPTRKGRIFRPIELDPRTEAYHFKDVTPKRTREEPGYRQYSASAANWGANSSYGFGFSPITVESHPASAPSAPQRQQIILLDQWPKPSRKASHCSSLSSSTRDDTTIEFSAPRGNYEDYFAGGNFGPTIPYGQYDEEAPPLTSSSVHSQSIHSKAIPDMRSRSNEGISPQGKIPELPARETWSPSGPMHEASRALGHEAAPDFARESARAGINVSLAKAATNWANKSHVTVIAKSSQGNLKYMTGFRVRLIETDEGHVLYLEKGGRTKAYPLEDLDAVEALDDCLYRLKQRFKHLQWPSEPTESKADAAESSALMLGLVFTGHRIPLTFKLKSYQEKAELIAVLAACLNKVAGQRGAQAGEGATIRPNHQKLRLVYYLLELPPTYSKAMHVRRSRSPEYRPFVFDSGEERAAFAALRAASPRAMSPRNSSPRASPRIQSPRS